MSSDRDGLLSALSQVVRRAQRATDLVDEAAAHLLGINRTDARCLDILDQHGQMTAGDLAREARLTTGAMTAAIDRLELAGLAERMPDPEDRRRVLVAMTEAARELSWKLFGPLAEQTGPVLERYTDEQLAMLVEFHELAAAVQERHAEWLWDQAAIPPSRKRPASSNPRR